RLVGQERQVTDDQRTGSRASHEFAVVHHLVHGNRDGGVYPLYDGADGIANEQHVDTAAIQNTGEWIIIRRERGNLLPDSLETLQFWDGDFCCSSGHEYILLTTEPEGAHRSQRAWFAIRLGPIRCGSKRSPSTLSPVEPRFWVDSFAARH